MPLVGQRRAADVAADGPGSCGPDLRPERERGVDAHHRPSLLVERRAFDRGIKRAAREGVDHDQVARRLHAEGAGPFSP
jgi:hypothetical protein